VVFFVRDLIDADGIFEHHFARSQKIEKAGAGRWMPARAEDDGHALSRQVIVGAQHVVIALNLVVDVMDAGAAARRQGHGVMDRVHPHQGDVADTIADPGIADLGPKLLVACRIRGIQAGMAESGNAGIARREISLPAPFGVNRQLDLVAGRALLQICLSKQNGRRILAT